MHCLNSSQYISVNVEEIVY